MRLIKLTAIAEAGDMFDGFVETQTETADAIVKTFDITGFNSVTILNTVGISASLEVDSVTQTVSLIRDSIKDWWDYWFAPTRAGKDVVFYFPTQSSGDATLTIAYSGGTAKCGMCITGLAAEIATTRTNINVGITDYSTIETDVSGNTSFAVGSWAKRANVDLHMTPIESDIAYRQVVENRGVACVFDYNEYSYTLSERHTSTDGLQPLIIYGYTEDYDTTLLNNNISMASHEAQGLI